MSKKHDHRRRRRRRTAPGAPPGTVEAHPWAPRSRIRVVRYGAGEPTETSLTSVAGLSELRDGAGVLWVDVVGLGDVGALEQIAGIFDVHRLTLEDIVNTHQRPKAERFDDYEYLVLRVPSPGEGMALRQVSLIVGDRYLLSFEEAEGASLDPIRDRIRARRGIICKGGADYLACAILDSAIDHYFPLLDGYADRLEIVERIVLREAGRDILPELYAIKEDLRECRRSVWPLRDLLGGLARDDHPRFTPETRLYLRDCYDHVNQLMELVESDRDTATGLMELHVSNVGNRMNEVMKVLTIIATIFIPLSFIAGLYGMNFDPTVSPWNMPELHWRYGYPYALLVMSAVAGGMLLFFRRRGWLGGRGANGRASVSASAEPPASPSASPASPASSAPSTPDKGVANAGNGTKK